MPGWSCWKIANLMTEETTNNNIIKIQIKIYIIIKQQQKDGDEGTNKNWRQWWQYKLCWSKLIVDDNNNIIWKINNNNHSILYDK